MAPVLPRCDSSQPNSYSLKQPLTHVTSPVDMMTPAVASSVCRVCAGVPA